MMLVVTEIFGSGGHSIFASTPKLIGVRTTPILEMIRRSLAAD